MRKHQFIALLLALLLTLSLGGCAADQEVKEELFAMSISSVPSTLSRSPPRLPLPTEQASAC